MEQFSRENILWANVQFIQYKQEACVRFQQKYKASVNRVCSCQAPRWTSTAAKKQLNSAGGNFHTDWLFTTNKWLLFWQQVIYYSIYAEQSQSGASFWRDSLEKLPWKRKSSIYVRQRTDRQKAQLLDSPRLSPPSAYSTLFCISNFCISS